jgi:uncharacterized phage protein gp47/JayE
MTTHVPSIVFGPTGPVAPAEADILAGVQADYNDAAGGALNFDKRTPQGQLTSSTAAIIADKNASIVYVANQFNPDVAADAFQDALARIYFIDRSPGKPTVVQVVCTGAFNTPIPLGAQIRDNNGNRYVCTLGGIIPIGGSITLPFECVVLGPTACPAGALNTSNGAQILTGGVIGWDTIANPLDGAVGANVESRAEFEYRRSQSVALNGHGSIVAIGAAVFDVPGVIDMYAIENKLDTTVNVGPTNYPVVAHSIYIAAVGGLPNDIGQAIFSKKNDGSNMNGNTNVTIVDTSYEAPQPTYTYTYNIPTNTALKFAVQVQNSAALPADIITQVQNAVVNSFTGADGSKRARIASTVLAGKYYAPISAIGPEVNVVSVLLNFKTAPLADQTNVTMGIDQFPTLQASDVAVTLV